MALTPPAGLTPTPISTTRIDLSWENRGSYDSVHIERKLSSNGGWVQIDVIGGTEEYYIDESPPLSPNTAYDYKIRARKLYPEEEYTGYTAPKSATTFAVLAAPSDLVVLAFSDFIELTFKDNSLEEVKFEIAREKDDEGEVEEFAWTAANMDYYRDEAVVAGSVYKYRVRAWRSEGDESAWTGIVSDTALSAPSAPTLAAILDADTKDKSIRIRWTDVASETGYKIEHFIWYATGFWSHTGLVSYDGTKVNDGVLNVPAFHTDTSAPNSFLKIDLGAGNDKEFMRVDISISSTPAYAIWDVEYSDNDADWFPAKVDVGGAPFAVGTHEFTWSKAGAHRYWRLLKTNIATSGGYHAEVQFYEQTKVVGIGVTNFLFTDLTVGSTYRFKVRAYNGVGTSGYSATRSKTTDAAYVPTEFEKWIRNPNIEPVYLAEIYTKMDLTGFTLESGVTWKKTIGASDRGIDILEVFEDGSAYSSTPTQISEVEALASSFWFDYDSRILYIHTSTGGNPSGFLIEGAFWLYFSTHKDIEFSTAIDQINTCDATTDWTASAGGVLSIDTVDKKEGVGSLKNNVAAPTATTVYYTEYNPTGSWDWSAKKHILFWLKCNRANTAFTFARVYIYDTSSNWRSWNLTFSAGEWTPVKKLLSTGDGQSGTPPNLALIERVQVRFQAADTTPFYKKIDDLRVTGRLNYFLPLLAKEDIPDITQEIKPYFEGSFSISSGSIAFMNAKIMGEHFFDKKFSAYTWINSKVILKAGRSDFTYDLTEDNKQFKEIFTAYVNEKSCSDAKITFQLRDIRREMTEPIVLNKFSRTEFPDMDEKHEGKEIPIAFGFIEGGVPIPIDIGNQKFKYHDGRSKAGVEFKVIRNDIELTLDTHYFIDAQRSIITFNRDGVFIIEAGVNDEIDFKEGGVTRNATLDPDTYTTADLCDQIKSKMDLAGGYTYTVTCSDAPIRKFKITGSSVFSLLWRSGDNGPSGTNTSVAAIIGFSDEEDKTGELFYEADGDVITVKEADLILVSFAGVVNSADELMRNGAEIFKYLMNTYKSLTDSELNLDSIYEAKYANENELAILIEKEVSFDEIVRTIEHSIEAYTFQDEFGRLGIKPQQTTVASNAKYIVSDHIFSHSQKKDRSTLFWKVNIYYNKDYNDDWDVKTATKDEINWKYKATEELPIYTYFSSPSHASDLATSILSLLNREQIENELPMLLFDVVPGDLIKFNRTRFYDSDGTASEITLRVLRISKSPATGKTNIVSEII